MTSDRRSPTGGPAIPLYKLRSVHIPGALHHVEIWDGNYVVCPTLWTTNGSHMYVAKLTADTVKAGVHTVEDAQIEADFTDCISIAQAIKAVLQPDG